MDRAEFIESLPSLKRELRTAEERAAAATQEAEALRGIIHGIECLAKGNTTQPRLFVPGETGTSDVVVEEPALRGSGAVRQVMSDGRPWKQQAIVAEVKRRGWFKPNSRNPDAAIRESVRRLVILGELTKVSSGTYQSVPEEEDDAGSL